MPGRTDAAVASEPTTWRYVTYEEDAHSTVKPLNLGKADTMLCAWRKKYDTPEKVAAPHRNSIRKQVAQSMAFEGQPVSLACLKALLKRKVKGQAD